MQPIYLNEKYPLLGSDRLYSVPAKLGFKNKLEDDKKGFDGQGNYILGIKEHIVFSEIGMEDLEKVHGLEIIVNTSAKDDKQAKVLLTNLGFPFKKVISKKE